MEYFYNVYWLNLIIFYREDDCKGFVFAVGDAKPEEVAI